MTTLVLRPARALSPLFSHRLAERAVLIVFFCLLTAACARVAIPVPGSPVPITLQTLAVTLAAGVLGGTAGTLSMVLYVALGAVGLPFYSDAAGGWQHFTGATMGYLVGFILAPAVMRAFVPGLLESRAGRVTITRLVGALLAAHAVVFALGLAWLSYSTGMGPADTLERGLFPFIPGLMAKIVLAVVLLRGTAGLIRR